MNLNFLTMRMRMKPCVFSKRQPFATLCGQIFRRLFRVYGIIYSSFFGTLEALGMAPHLNTCFKHFMFFCTEFSLLPEREIEPLEFIVKPIRKQYYISK